METSPDDNINITELSTCRLRRLTNSASSFETEKNIDAYIIKEDKSCCLLFASYAQGPKTVPRLIGTSMHCYNSKSTQMLY